MKQSALRLALLALVIAPSFACRAARIHDLDERVQSLESRVATLEGKMSAQPSK